MSPRQKLTMTGGRTATTRHIFGERVLSVGLPINQPAPTGWKWVLLSEVATMESGHTPSREHPEYWNGDIPWLGVRDAGKNHGTVISDTSEHTNQLGIDNSSARLLPAGTVCLSRGGTVGYVVMLGRPMCTSQGFANWICGPELDARFLMHLLLSEKNGLDRFAMGTTIQTIYYPDLKALYVCIPSVPEQQRIVRLLDKAFDAVSSAKTSAEKNIQNVRVLFGSYLRAAFAQDVVQRDGGAGDQGAVLKSTWRKLPLSDVVSMRPGNNKIIKGKQSDRPGPDLFPAFSASGQDVWVSSADYNQPGVVVSAVGARCGKTFIAHGKWSAIANTHVLLPGEDIDPRWLWYRTNDESFWIRGGTAQPFVKVRDTLQQPCIIPPLTEQQRIVHSLDQLSRVAGALASAYAKKIVALQDLQASLRDQAFRGELKAA